MRLYKECMEERLLVSKLDLKEGYHPLELEEHSKEITTFSTHKELFRFKRFIFGMNTAFEVFQRTLQHGLSNCEE